MQQQLVSIPGYRVYEYLLVINPHEELRNRIAAIKEDFSGKYKTALAHYTKPHITLVKFFAYEMSEEKLFHRLQVIAMGLTPFKIELKDFGSFPSHSIYINVTTKLPIQHVVRELKSAQQLMTLNKDAKPHFIEDAHFTICRKLKPWQYEQGWLEYSHRHFSGRFIADGMLLLKRPAGAKGYVIDRRFEFQNLPVATKQGSLFSSLSPGGGTPFGETL
jgi:2'-5' RNA ligase